MGAVDYLVWEGIISCRNMVVLATLAVIPATQTASAIT
jgi:hypothetical protein